VPDQKVPDQKVPDQKVPDQKVPEEMRREAKKWMKCLETVAPHAITDKQKMKCLQPLADKVVKSVEINSLVSLVRRTNTAALSLLALFDRVPGDFVETGVYMGSTSLIMAKVLHKYSARARLLWSADSFQGFPEEDVIGMSAAHVHTSSQEAKEDIKGTPRVGYFGKKGAFYSARQVFEQNLAKYNFTDGQVHILQGWFNETLPKAPIRSVSFLRLDGDLFVSTWDALTALYDKVQPGGLIYVDDYGSFAGCRDAIVKFRADRGIEDEMHPVYELKRNGKRSDKFEALWWRKGSGRR